MKKNAEKRYHNQVYQKIKQLSTKKNGRKTGKLLTEPKPVLNR